MNHQYFFLVFFKTLCYRKTIFDNLHPYIKKGTLIAFDEWCYNFSESCNDHEQKAFYEYVDDYNIKFKFIDYPCPEVERKLLKIL